MKRFGGGLFVVVAFCYLFDQTTAFRCYLCESKGNDHSHCLYPESYNVSLVKCNREALDKTREFAMNVDPTYGKIFEVDTEAMARHIDLDCLKVVAENGRRKYVFRGCQLAEQKSLDICHKMTRADAELLKTKYCSRCSSDRCNSTSKTKVNFNLVALIVFLYKYA